MSKMRVTIRPPAGVAPPTRPLAVFLLVVCTCAVLIAALFPFDFSMSGGDFVGQIRREFNSSPWAPTLEDRIVNVIFFVPLGMCIAAVVRVRRGERIWRIASAVVGGAVLSSIVEVGQVFIGFRDPTWSDIVMNTIGAGIGATSYVLAGGDRAIEWSARKLAKLDRIPVVRNGTVGTVGTIIFAGCVLLLPLVLRDRGALSNWETAYPLLIGNELNGSRPWVGRVSELVIASRAIADDEVARMVGGEGWRVLGDSVVGAYSTIGTGPYVDQTGNLPKLEWVKRPREDQGEREPANTSEQHWLKSEQAVSVASRRIRESGAFTVAVTCATDETWRDGPGRIVTISVGTDVRNLTLGQEGPHLAIRLRNRTMGESPSPQIEVDGVFVDERPRSIIVSYANTVLRVWIDGQPRGHLEITPEAALIWRMYPRGSWRLRIDQAGTLGLAIVFRLLVFIPFAALLAWTVSKLPRVKPAMRWLVVAGAIIGLAVALEVELAAISANGFQLHNLIVSLVIPTLVAVAMLWRRTRPSFR